MGKKGCEVKTIEVMVGCPEDAEKYLKNIYEGIELFNQGYGKENMIKIVHKHWKYDSHSSPGNPQEEILKQIGQGEMLIAFFYLSMGSANASEKPGTITEIEYFCKAGKQVFVFYYDGIIETDRSGIEKISKEVALFNENKNIALCKPYKDEKDLKALTENELEKYFCSRKKTTGASKGKRRRKAEEADPNVHFRNLVKEHMRFIDQWLELDKNFYFEKESKALVESMEADGKVSYYTNTAERYRTTPVASTLQALSAADLLPKEVEHKMQDWVFASRTDKSDPAGEIPSEYKGHPPKNEDKDGWSVNEGVSVWTTSKTLEALLCTNYFMREDIRDKQEVLRNTYNAIEWLVNQQNNDGGWGFQKCPEHEACSSCVTITALVLKVLAIFRLQREENGIFKDGPHTLYNKIDEAHDKGMIYLNEAKILKENVVCWKYDGKISVTGSVWVLDWLNYCDAAVCDLAKSENKKKIISGILASIPEDSRGFWEYKEEVYFRGGKTKYKDIKEYKKFYSYMPYHAKVLMEAGVAASDKRIVNIVNNLLTGKSSKWKAMESREGIKKSTTYVHAMSLSIIALWLKNISSSSYTSLVQELKKQEPQKEFETEDWDKLISNVREELLNVERESGKNENN